MVLQVEPIHGQHQHHHYISWQRDNFIMSCIYQGSGYCTFTRDSLISPVLYGDNNYVYEFISDEARFALNTNRDGQMNTACPKTLQCN